MKLNDITADLYESLMKETGIAPESVSYETHTKFIQYLNLEGIDVHKAFERYMKTYQPYAEFCHETPVVG